MPPETNNLLTTFHYGMQLRFPRKKSLLACALPIVEIWIALEHFMTHSIHLQYRWKRVMLLQKASQWTDCLYGDCPTIGCNDNLMSGLPQCWDWAQPITAQRLHHSNATTDDGACFVIKARVFNRQCTFFDIRVINTTYSLSESKWDPQDMSVLRMSGNDHQRVHMSTTYFLGDPSHIHKHTRRECIKDVR